MVNYKSMSAENNAAKQLMTDLGWKKGILGKKARAFDLDDTLIGRQPFVRVSGAIVGKIKPHHLPNLTAEEIAALDVKHDPVDHGISSPAEAISYAFHSVRRVYPGIRPELRRISSEDTDIFGNTGRLNTTPWIEMTRKTLQRGDVADLFKGVYFTPKGTRTAVSKAHVVGILSELYEEVEFDDDDPRTAVYIAERFPDVNVNLVQHGSTGILMSAREIDRLPNLRRVAVLGSK